MLPETYLGVDLSSFRGFDLSNMKRVVFNQNAYYSFGDFNSNTAQDLKNFYDNSLVLQVLTVSEDSHTFLSRNLGIRDKCLSRIVNSIERSFRPNQEKVKRMHWMPRKIRCMYSNSSEFAENSPTNDGGAIIARFSPFGSC